MEESWSRRRAISEADKIIEYFIGRKYLIAFDVKKMGRIHGVEDILLGFEPKDAGSIPAGSAFVVLSGSRERGDRSFGRSVEFLIFKFGAGQ
jgi:hypothetical protein